MNTKTAKLLRKTAQKMGVTSKSAITAFKRLDREKQIAFITKVKQRFETYGK